MLEPRPEIRTATLTLSAMVDGAPVAARAPGAGRAGDRAAPLALFDPADPEEGFASFVKRLRDGAHIIFSDDQRHADAAIEGSGEFLRLDIALRLEEGHQPRLRPA